jgi:hypothetical protein
MQTIFVARPSPDALSRFRDSMADRDFSYPSAGATRNSHHLPSGFTIDRTRAELGKGAADFAKEKARRSTLLPTSA